MSKIIVQYVLRVLAPAFLFAAPFYGPSVAQVLPPQPKCAPDRLAQNELLGVLLFTSGDFHLEASALRMITTLAKGFPDPLGQKVLVIGFADPDGTPAANLAISRKRAAAVAGALQAAGVKPAQIMTIGCGDDLLLAPPQHGDQAHNRRVEIRIGG
jgi:outer membrane protein OmpA-like peptidoglycan-associated protein